MTAADVVNAIADTFANLAWVGAIVFVFSYGVFFRWTEKPAGRSIMAFAAAVVAFSSLSLLGRNVEKDLTYEYIRLFIFIFVFSAAWGMVIVLWRGRYRAEHRVAPPKTTILSLSKERTVTNQDKIISYIRTGVPALVGVALTWLVSRIPAVGDWLNQIDAYLAQFGFVGASVNGLLVAGGTAAAIAGYYALARWIGEKFPAAEKWLLGRSAVPVYLKPEEAAVITDAIPAVEDRQASATPTTSVTFGEEVVITDDAR